MVSFFTFIIANGIFHIVSAGDENSFVNELFLRTKKITSVKIPLPICPYTLCDIKPVSFAFQYTGSSCEDSSNLQGEKFSCEESKDYRGEVIVADTMKKGAHIIITSKKDNGKVYFNDWVMPGDTLNVNDGGSKLPADMHFEITDAESNDLYFVTQQSMNIHTSCSKNLYLGDQFGGLKVVGIQSEKGEEINCEWPEPTVSPSQSPSATPSVRPTIKPSPVPSFSPSSSPTSGPSSTPTIAASNRPSSSISPSSKPSMLPQPTVSPSQSPSATPSIHPTINPSPVPSFSPSSSPTSGPSSVCSRNLCTERPNTMNFLFKVGNCESNSNSQEDKFVCTDFLEEMLLTRSVNYYVVVSASKSKKNNMSSKNNSKRHIKRKGSNKEKEIKSQSSEKNDSGTENIMIEEEGYEDIYFKGMVQNGAIFDAGKGAATKFATDLNVKIFSPDGDGVMLLLQSFLFHSSCSKNLALGDRFASVELVGIEYNDGSFDKCY